MTVLLLAMAISTGPLVMPDEFELKPLRMTDVCDTACRERIRWRRTVAPHRAHLRSIRACEVRGQPHPWRTNTGNGFYGAYQFALGSWRVVGGSGYPHHASPLEQSYRAVLLSRQGGWGHWPVCG